MGKLRSDDDPAWSRSNSSLNVTKKKKRTRSNMRILRSLMKNRKAMHKGSTVCVTRTVELSSAQSIGKESSKLLFMLALGLVPNSDAVDKRSPSVKLARLDPEVEAQAKEKTREAVFQIFQQQNLQRRTLNTIKLAKNVEVVDLVSSEDELSDSDDDHQGLSMKQPLRFCVDHSTETAQARRGQLSTSSVNFKSPSFRIIQPSPRKPVFKQLGNNQDNRIFRNWTPETLTRIMNAEKPVDKSKSPPGIYDQTATIVSSLKSVPSNIINSAKFFVNVSQGGSYKNQPNGISEHKRTPTMAPEFISAETIITID